jgi:GNAT superfamily N-acetyltransferase
VTLPPDLRERPARAADARAVGELMRACDETYAAWAPAGWSAPPLLPDWRVRLEDAGRWSRVAVDAAGAVVAFVSFRQARSLDPPGGPAGQPVPGVAHVGALFVHPSRWREGIASALLARAEAAMLAGGYGRALLWTPSGAPAERFYRAHGWEADGRSGFHDWLGLPVVGYAKTLAADPPRRRAALAARAVPASRGDARQAARAQRRGP